MTGSTWRPTWRGRASVIPAGTPARRRPPAGPCDSAVPLVTGRPPSDTRPRVRQVAHLSVLEHSTATFYITGISRSVTHELIRHRHFSYSQLSQRYLPPDGPRVVEPDLIAAAPALHERFTAAVSASALAYAELLGALETAAAQAPDGTLARKQARQAARAVLPNATATAVVVTGNYRAWRWRSAA